MHKGVILVKVGHSGRTAKMRLRFLLISDKAECSPEIIRLIQNDMIRVISKYMEIEKDKVGLVFEREGLSESSGEPALLKATIPVRSISNKGLF